MNPSVCMVQSGGGGGGGGGGSGAGGDGGWGPFRWFRKKKDGPAAVTLTLVSFAVSRKAYSRVRPLLLPRSQRPLPLAELQAAGSARFHLCTVPGLRQEDTGVQDPPCVRSYRSGSRCTVAAPGSCVPDIPASLELQPRILGFGGCRPCSVLGTSGIVQA